MELVEEGGGEGRCVSELGLRLGYSVSVGPGEKCMQGGLDGSPVDGVCDPSIEVFLPFCLG